MLGLVFSDLGPVEEEVDRKALALDFSIGETRDNVPREVYRVLLDVGQCV